MITYILEPCEFCGCTEGKQASNETTDKVYSKVACNSEDFRANTAVIQCIQCDALEIMSIYDLWDRPALFNGKPMDEELSIHFPDPEKAL